MDWMIPFVAFVLPYVLILIALISIAAWGDLNHD
jgi:hypothetical protein